MSAQKSTRRESSTRMCRACRVFSARAICSSSTIRKCFRRGCSARACRAAAPSNACSSRISTTDRMGCARASGAEAAARRADDLPRHAARAARRGARSPFPRPAHDSALVRRTARASRTRSTTSATCRCRRTSSATTRPSDRDGIRPSTRASAVRSRRRRPAFISRLSFSTALRQRGVERTAITLHVGYGTFQPVRVDQVEAHTIDAERFSISEAAADAINRAKREKRRVVAVGTTTTRALEAAGRAGRGIITPQSGWSDLFIYPGFRFGIVDALMTNFHLPRVVAADAGVRVRRPRGRARRVSRGGRAASTGSTAMATRC